jgi:RND superfamily putative drug exporter
MTTSSSPPSNPRSTPSRAGVTLRAARWSASHPWRALLVWIAFVAAAVTAGSMVTTQETNDADYRVGQSGKADQIITDAGLAGADTESVLITAPGSDQLTAAQAAEAQDAAADVRRRMANLDGVSAVRQSVWSPDRSALLVPIALARDQGTQPDPADLEAVTSAVQRAHPSLEVAESGDVTLDGAIDDRVGEDLASAEGLSLPITLAIMLLAFGAVIAAGIPVLLALSGVIATMGIYAPLSYLVPSEPTVSSMILLIGMAVGVDYSLFYLKREREERERGLGTVDAVDVAAATSGHSIVVSGFAVIVSMAGLYVTGDATFASLATGAIVVVAVTVLGSLTVLPALLSKLGRWVDRPRVPLLWRVNRRIGRGGISRRLLAPVLRHPKTSLLISGLIIAALAVPALSMKMDQASLQTLPQDVPEVQTAQAIQKAFPSEGSTMEVAVQAGSRAEASDVVPTLEKLADQAKDVGLVSGPDAIRTSHDGTVSVLTLASPDDEQSPAAKHALESLRDDLAPAALDPLPGTEWAIGGDAAESADFAQQERDVLPLVIGFVLLLTLVMMGVTFRSVPIALITTVLNLASVAAAFGVLSLVFQHSWAEGMLDFTSSGYVIDWIPLFLFVVLVGLSMDYHVFVLSRVREGVRRGLPSKVAVEAGVTETAGVVTSAAAVMVSVFAIFATLSMLEMKQMGVGLSVAILIDATLVRVVMLPSILTLMGDKVWWPQRVRRPQPEPVVVEEPPVMAGAR